MINKGYNYTYLDDVIESDVDRCGSYVALYYEFPFPEISILREREDEEMRYQMKKNPLIALSCENQSI